MLVVVMARSVPFIFPQINRFIQLKRDTTIVRYILLKQPDDLTLKSIDLWLHRQDRATTTEFASSDLFHSFGLSDRKCVDVHGITRPLLIYLIHSIHPSIYLRCFSC